MWTASVKAYGPCLQRCQGTYEMCQQVAQSFEDMYTCKFAFKNCRKACPGYSAEVKVSSMENTGDVTEEKRRIGAIWEQQRKMAILENLLDQLNE